MNKELTEEQIKKLVEGEKKVNPYKDDIDVTMDSIINLYESKKINEETLKLAISFLISSAMKETTSDLTKELLRRNTLRAHSSEPNKLLLLNYSKKHYA